MLLSSKILSFFLMRFRFLATFVAMAGLMTAASAREQVTIQKGANGDAQARGGAIYLDEQNANSSSGGGTLQVRGRTGQRQRTLVLFDLSSLPSNIAVKTATLTLHTNGFTNMPAAGRTYGAHNLTDFWTQNASWNNRTTDPNNKSTAWTAVGGDFNGTATNTLTIKSTSTSVSFNITGDAQNWYDGTANYGTLIKDENEGNGTGTNAQTTFNSFSDGTQASRPALILTYLQNVSNASATPGNGTVTVNWTNPTIQHAFNGETYNGVVILRRADAPVDKNSFPTDTQAPPALCATVGSGTVVYVGTGSSLTDNGICGALTNGTQYFYKIFVRDSANYYSHNVVASTFTSEAAAIPGTDQTLAWTIATHSYNLGGGGLIPGSLMVVGADTAQLFSVNLATGQRGFPAVALGGTVSSRPPVLDASISSNAKQVAYVTAQDGYVYGVDTGSTANGQILWLANLGSNGTAGNTFTGGAGVQVKQYSGSFYTPTFDSVFVGTHNANTTTANSIFALNGTTGAVVWTFTGNNTNKMDLVNSTPTVDYTNNALWVTSQSNGGKTQPNLWKMNPLTGAITGTGYWSMNLFSSATGTVNGDIDSSPSLTQNGDVLFVSTNAGTLFAINPAATTSATAVMGSYAAGDGAIIGFPFIVSTTNPYTVVFTGATMVHAVSFNKNTKVFTKLWDSQTFTSPSAPVVYNFSTIYIGTAVTAAGTTPAIAYELSLSTGAVTGQRVLDSGNNPMYISEPSLDTVMNRVYFTTTTNDQRTYAYGIPF